MVTSPGGTSAAALHELESGRLRTVLSEAVWAAYRRTVELGDQLEAGTGAGRPITRDNGSQTGH
jgi:pyrroline-5-carboxylate reductase